MAAYEASDNRTQINIAVASDVGGTFTDVASWDGSELVIVKTPSTPVQSDGAIEGILQATHGERSRLLLHGTTVATNALLERSGARVSLITDAGFEDLIEIGRQDRPSLYDPFQDRSEPLVERQNRYGYSGDGVPTLARRLTQSDPQAVVVALLGGYAHPERELRLVEALVAEGLDREMIVAAGVELGEFREFERMSTAVLTGYLRPVIRRYLALLQRELVPELVERLLVMRSSGGLVDPREAVFRAASILLSGPAGGVMAASALSRALGYSMAISFDMGGTSTDVCRIENARPEISYERTVDGYVCRMPSVAVHTVGAGGGSLGWIDAGGALRVGPGSAGAHPGPACYERGGIEPAVTDANLLVGRLGMELAGSVSLSASAAEAALARLATKLEMDPAEVALGMIQVVESHMERAIRRVSVEEGADPRRSTLVAFGGAGGLHAVALARRLEMKGVAVPPHAGVFSAIGLLVSSPRADVGRSALLRADSADRLDLEVRAVASEALSRFERSIGRKADAIETTVDIRYVGQAHETPVRYQEGEGWPILALHFHEAHLKRNGFAREDDPIEVVTVRAAATGSPALAWNDLPPHRPSGEQQQRGTRMVLLEGGESVRASVWWRPALATGDEVRGPAVIEEQDSTTYLEPGSRALVHESGTLEIEW